MPSRPPSPKFFATPRIVMTVRALPPPRGMRLILPVARSETSASPLGRKATPQGTFSPVATTPGSPTAAGAVVGNARSASPATMASAMRRAGMGRDPSERLQAWTPVSEVGREGVAALGVTRLEPAQEPIGALLRRAVRPRLGADLARRLGLDPVVADRCCGGQALLEITALEQPPLVRRVPPDAGEAVRLQL